VLPWAGTLGPKACAATLAVTGPGLTVTTHCHQLCCLQILHEPTIIEGASPHLPTNSTWVEQTNPEIAGFNTINGQTLK
jgi:hypothetical protein